MIQNTIFLTFDIDWACDEVLAGTIDFIETEKITATFFVTHDTPLLERLRNNSDIELGIHPNFTGSLSSEWGNIISTLKLVVPDAVSVRSHSLMQSSHLLDLFLKHDLTHDVNLYIPFYSGIKLSPFYSWNDILRIPYFWEDDAFCIAIKNGYESNWNVDRFLDYPGLKVFDFHPIHIFLNTEDLYRYETARIHHNANNLRGYCCRDDHHGTRVFLQNLISASKKRGMTFGRIKDITL